MSETTYAGSVGVAINLAAPGRCEMCGALLTGADDSPSPAWDAVEAVRIIADLWLWDSVACGIVLAKMIHPDATYRQLGRMVNLSHVAVQRRLEKLESEYPHIGYFVRNHGPHAQAQKARKRANDCPTKQPIYREPRGCGLKGP